MVDAVLTMKRTMTSYSSGLLLLIAILSLLLAQTNGDSWAESIQQSVSSCPSDWIEFQGHCYLYVEYLETWVKAENDCKSKGGHLASVHSADENSFIYNRWFGAWLGATDAAAEVGTHIQTYTRLPQLKVIVKSMYCVFLLLTLRPISVFQFCCVYVLYDALLFLGHLEMERRDSLGLYKLVFWWAIWWH